MASMASTASVSSIDHYWEHHETQQAQQGPPADPLTLLASKFLSAQLLAASQEASLCGVLWRAGWAAECCSRQCLASKLGIPDPSSGLPALTATTCAGTDRHGSPAWLPAIGCGAALKELEEQ